MLDLKQHPHRRFNLLNGSWVLVSPHRTQRPWQGQVEKTRVGRATGVRSRLLPVSRQLRAPVACAIRPYTSTFVFDNDFAALLPAHARRSRGIAAAC